MSLMLFYENERGEIIRLTSFQSINNLHLFLHVFFIIENPQKIFRSTLGIYQKCYHVHGHYYGHLLFRMPRQRRHGIQRPLCLIIEKTSSEVNWWGVHSIYRMLNTSSRRIFSPSLLLTIFLTLQSEEFISSSLAPGVMLTREPCCHCRWGSSKSPEPVMLPNRTCSLLLRGGTCFSPYLERRHYVLC